MMAGRAHQSQVDDLVGVQRERNVDALDDDRLEPSGGSFVEPVALARLYPDESERAVQLGEMARSGGDDDEQPVGAQHPVHLGQVARREDVEEHGDGVVGHRPGGGDVEGDRADPGMGTRRATQGVLRDVDGDADRVRPRTDHAGQMVPGPGTDVEDHPTGRPG